MFCLFVNMYSEVDR